MSKYTTEVRYICESLAGLTESVGYNRVDDIITQAAPKIFSFQFPIFDENYRLALEKKILKHYYTREIGLETYGLWQLKLDTKMNEIMPYFNQRYKSATIEFNPLYDFEVTRTHELKKDETGNSSSTGTNKGTATDTTESTQQDINNSKRTNAFSETPQGSLENVENGTYLTTGEVDRTEVDNQTSVSSNNNRTADSLTTSNSVNTINSTEDYVERVNGKQGASSYSKLLEEYRQTFLNIDMEVIDSLSDLFMNLW